MRYHLYRI